MAREPEVSALPAPYPHSAETGVEPEHGPKQVDPD